jgi:predicted nucleotidyltransferase
MKDELAPLINVLNRLRHDDKIHIAILFGSFANGKPHKRSDIDLAIYINLTSKSDVTECIDSILMSVERDINILRLDDEEESPFVVQEALKGKHLVEPDLDALYGVADRVLHETEGIRFRRLLVGR